MLGVAALLLCVALFARADNPMVQTIYTADPAPLVYNGRVYAFLDHDEDGSKTYIMKDWRLFSSADMVNWQDHGVVMSLKTFSWANANAWAGQVINRNNKFYYYAPMRHNNGQMAIGVGVSDTVTGPYKDALGKPLVMNGQIDPTVWIDDDGQAYMFWGNPDLQYVKLNSDMLSYSGGIVKIPLTPESFGKRVHGPSAQRPSAFEEGPWVYKRNSTYYLVFAADCCSENIQYSTAPHITGPYKWRGVVQPTEGASFTNHPGVIEFKGGNYFWYHNGALPGGSGYTRSVCVEKFDYTADGGIPQVRMTSAGVPQIGTLDPYVRQEAVTIAFSYGLKTEVCSEGGMNVANVDNNDYIKVKGVAFGSGAKTFSVSVSSASNGGKIELRLKSKTGTLIGTCSVSGTGGWQSWKTVTCPVNGATGTQDLFLVFTGGSGFLFNLHWWQFSA